jgi:hypothetical protein
MGQSLHYSACACWSGGKTNIAELLQQYFLGKAFEFHSALLFLCVSCMHIHASTRVAGTAEQGWATSGGVRDILCSKAWQHAA